jgi:lysophospholipase
LANSIVGPIIQFLNASIPQPGVELDVVRYPNPFFGVAKHTFIDSSQTVLSMVDGGEDGEVIPIQPLLVKAREVDVIIAIDAVRVDFDLVVECR